MISLAAALIISGVVSLVGGAVSSAVSYGMQKDSQDFNSAEAEMSREFSAEEAQKNRDWQEQMRSTAYQTQVEDMKKAGINPALAGLNGVSGNAAPPMPSAAQASSYMNRASDFSNGLSSAAIGYILKHDAKLADRALTNAANSSAKRAAENEPITTSWVADVNGKDENISMTINELKELRKLDWFNKSLSSNDLKAAAKGTMDSPIFDKLSKNCKMFVEGVSMGKFRYVEENLFE